MARGLLCERLERNELTKPPKEKAMKILSKLAVVLPLLAACGGAPTQNDFRQSEMQCSLSLSASSNALQVQQAVNDVNEGLRDPCAGAVENVHSMDISLVRIDTDPDTKELVLLFRVSRFHQEPSRR